MIDKEKFYPSWYNTESLCEPNFHDGGNGCMGQFAVDIMDHIVNCSLTKILDYFHHFNSRRCNCFSFIRYYLSSSNLFHIMTGRNQNCRGGAYCPVVLLNSTTKLWTCDCNFGCQAKMYFFMKEMASTKPSKPTDDDELVVRQHPTGDR